MDARITQRKYSKEDLYTQVIKAGCIPAKNNAFKCGFHKDKTPSSWIKRSANGTYYWRCAVCSITHDVWSLEAENRGLSIGELFKEYLIEDIAPPKSYYYSSIEELADSIPDLASVEEINPYSNPDTGNIDLLTIRYLPRGEGRKQICQAHQTSKGFIKQRPAGLLPLFNRKRLSESKEAIYCEGEKCVRRLTELGFVATTGSGGTNNANAHDYSPLAGKTVYLWSDLDDPGHRYMQEVKEKLLELNPIPEVFEIKIEEELPIGSDVVDLCDKVLAEGGSLQDCKDYINDLIKDASEVNNLEGLENFLEKMRSGEYANLPVEGFPMLTQEAALLLPKRIGVVYGGAGGGKSLFIGKLCDDLLLAGHKVVRLHLEDELEQYLTRSLAQRTLRSEICIPKWHEENPDASRAIYEQFKPTLEEIVPSIVAGEGQMWDDKKILEWMAFQFRLGKELVVVDPVSVISDNQIWLTMHRLIWGTKKLLSDFPNSRVVFVSHNNSEGEIAGGQSLRRFASSAVLLLNRYHKPKEVELIDRYGEVRTEEIDAGITIVKSRYGTGFPGMEIAIKLNKQTLCLEELGIVTKEVKKSKSIRDRFNDLNSEDL